MRRLLVLLLLLPLPALAADRSTQLGAPWHLDRVDQHAPPLDGAFHWRDDGSGVTAYVVDTGVRPTARELAGRVTTGIDTVDGGPADDCNGHGTHVAGLLAGDRHGVAKRVRVVAVRVLDCAGRGSESAVRRGLEWVLSHHRPRSVVNLSLGGRPSPVLDDLVRRLARAGVVVVAAAGNGDASGRAVDACTTSPARTRTAITVSATDRADRRAPWADYGRCVDVFAPGVDVSSAWWTSDTATRRLSGTSMAAPLVAGAAAVYLSGHPAATPADVRAALVRRAGPGVSDRAGSPDRLLYVL